MGIEYNIDLNNNLNYLSILKGQENNLGLSLESLGFGVQRQDPRTRVGFTRVKVDVFRLVHL